jgi:DNA-binding helix-hairpin-helix protein with protein kinase domain
MTHAEMESLLGVYALDATEARESAEIAAHLAECPRCRAEVQAHQEVAAMLGSAGGEVPPGLWAKISASLASTSPVPGEPVPERPLAGGPPAATPLPRRRQGARRALGWSSVGALAAAVAAVLGVEVANLHSQVDGLRADVARQGIAGAAAAASASPHTTIRLLATNQATMATVIVLPSGAAYWVTSSLSDLPSSRTYQLWGLAHGRPVSVGLMGPDPRTIGYFRLEAGTTKLMVTAEPGGGTPLPTTAVLAVGDVPPSALS